MTHVKQLDVKQGRCADGRLVFVLLFTAYFLFVLCPILWSGRFCNDDLARALDGPYGWNANGRPLTAWLMRALGLNLKPLVDFSPLPQLLAIAILAFTGVLIARRYSLRSPWLAALVALPLGAQPFFLENLSFRFDAPAMTLAILLALLPVLSLRHSHRDFLLGALSLLGGLCTYQPAINVFLIFALLDLVVAQAEGQEPKQLVKLALRHIAQVAIAIAIYQWAVVPSIKDWVKEHSQIIHSVQQLGVVADNARMMSTYILDSMDQRWMSLLVPLILLSAVSPLVIGVRYTVSPASLRTRPFWVTAALAAFTVLLPLVALACVAGPMLLLVSPVLMPRVFLGVGALISAGLIALHVATVSARARWVRYSPLAIASPWALCMLVFAGIYGNALAAQQQYENRIASTLADDLAELKETAGVTRFLMVGSAGLAPLTMHAAERFHLLNTLVLPYLQESDFNSRNFMKHYGTGLMEVRQAADGNTVAARTLTRACGANILHRRARYTLRVVEDIAVVTFPDATAALCERPSSADPASP